MPSRVGEAVGYYRAALGACTARIARGASEGPSASPWQPGRPAPAPIAEYQKAIALKPEYARGPLVDAWATPFATRATCPAPSPSTRRPSPSSRSTQRPITTWAEPCTTKATDPAPIARIPRRPSASKPEHAAARQPGHRLVRPRRPAWRPSPSTRKAIALKPEFAEARPIATWATPCATQGATDPARIAGSTRKAIASSSRSIPRPTTIWATPFATRATSQALSLNTRRP